MPGSIVAAHLQYLHPARMQARKRGVFLESFEFPFIRRVLGEARTINNFDGVIISPTITRQPHFSVGSASDAAEQFVLRNSRSGFRGRLGRRTRNGRSFLLADTRERFYPAPQPNQAAPEGGLFMIDAHVIRCAADTRRGRRSAP